MINTNKQINNIDKQLCFIDIGTLSQFIAKNHRLMKKIHSFTNANGTGIYMGLTADGKIVVNDTTSDLLSCLYLLLPSYDPNSTADNIIDDLLATYYQKCQMRLKKQKSLDGKVLKHACLYGSKMFTAKSYTNYIVANLDAINPSDIALDTIIGTGYYGLCRLVVELNNYPAISDGLCKALIKYCLSYQKGLRLASTHELEKELLYILIKKLQKYISVAKIDIKQFSLDETDINNLSNFDNLLNDELPS